MFKFFTTRKWWRWSLAGTVVILASVISQVLIDVKINEWFGGFYDTLQKVLTDPTSVQQSDFTGLLFIFAAWAGLWVIISTLTDFFVSHWMFRWRTSMADRYHDLFDKVAHIEGSSQRVQEDTLKFARLMESLGVGLLQSILTLAAFTPILWTLSKKVTELPLVGHVENSLVVVAIVAALGGTLLLALVGIKLPGIEYDIQKEEAAYRKHLVKMEDDNAEPYSLLALYERVRKIHYKSYLNYMYFNLAKWSYLQGMVIVPYVALTPTLFAGAITLGFVQQISRAFGRVETSLQYLVRSWTSVVELISVFKRLKEFERSLA